MKKLVIFISIILATMIVAPNSYSHVPDVDINGDGDALPWPWGTECPFPWSDIQGVWMAKAASESGETKSSPSGYYQFKVLSEWQNGTKVFEVTKFNQWGLVIGEGKGYSPSSQKIVRAVILADEKGVMPNHRVIVRAYTQIATQSCGGSLVTVLTTRAMDGDRSLDNHFILNKLGPGAGGDRK